jgi:hypothetical protein
MIFWLVVVVLASLWIFFICTKTTQFPPSMHHISFIYYTTLDNLNVQFSCHCEHGQTLRKDGSCYLITTHDPDMGYHISYLARPHAKLIGAEDGAFAP